MELKSCPFCGSTDLDPEYLAYDDGTISEFVVLCNECYSQGPIAVRIKSAQLLWQTRTVNIKK